MTTAEQEANMTACVAILVQEVGVTEWRQDGSRQTSKVAVENKSLILGAMMCVALSKNVHRYVTQHVELPLPEELRDMLL